MAGPEWWDSSPGLRSVFPAIVQATSERASTAEIWQAIRDAASSIAGHTLSITLGREPTADELANASATILAGVSATDVSMARGAAQGIVSAHANLIDTPVDNQIMADAIARPPWSITTTRAGVQEQYRIRVQREITFHGFTDITREEWATYDLNGPLTTIADALAQADTLFQQADYNQSVDINQVLDYSIEAV